MNATATILRDIVEKRLLALDRNPFDAARKAEPPLERSYINDLLKGRKKSVRDEKMPQLASALDWTVADLAAARAKASALSPAEPVVARREGSSGTMSPGTRNIRAIDGKLLTEFGVFVAENVLLLEPPPDTPEEIAELVEFSVKSFEERQVLQDREAKLARRIRRGAVNHREQTKPAPGTTQK